MLIAADNGRLTSALQDLLSKYELVVVPSVLEAANRLAQRPFDALVIDRRVPLGGGETPDAEGGPTLLEWVRSTGLRQRLSERLLPVVYLSPKKSEHSDPYFMLKAGPNDALKLPLHAAEFRRRFEEALLGLTALQPTGPRDVKLRFFGARGEIVQVEALPPLVEKYARVIHGLVPAYRQGLNQGLPPEAFPWTPRHELAATLGLEEQTVSQYSCALRKQLAESFRTGLNRELGEQAVIQWRRRRGYRLNPFLVRVEVHLPTDGPNWWIEANDERTLNEARISTEQST